MPNVYSKMAINQTIKRERIDRINTPNKGGPNEEGDETPSGSELKPHWQLGYRYPEADRADEGVYLRKEGWKGQGCL